MKGLICVILFFLCLLQFQCRTLFEIGNGNIFPYGGTIKNWKCITTKLDEDNPTLDQLQKLFCVIDFPMSFSFDTVFLFITIPNALKSEEDGK